MKYELLLHYHHFQTSADISKFYNRIVKIKFFLKRLPLIDFFVTFAIVTRLKINFNRWRNPVSLMKLICPWCGTTGLFYYFLLFTADNLVSIYTKKLNTIQCTHIDKRVLIRCNATKTCQSIRKERIKGDYILEIERSITWLVELMFIFSSCDRSYLAFVHTFCDDEKYRNN